MRGVENRMAIIDWCPEPDGLVDLSIILFPLLFGIVIGIVIGMYLEFKRLNKKKEVGK